jgi:hypothetical protein
MPKNDATPEGRSQSLTFAPGDMVTLDRKTYRELMKLVGRASDAVLSLRECEIMITSLDRHIRHMAAKNQENSLDISQALLLSQCWKDMAPDTHKHLDDCLSKAFETLQVVLAATDLGGKDE